MPYLCRRKNNTGNEKVIPSFIFIGLPALSGGQAIISGTVVDENSQPLPYANVILLSQKDSSIITGTVTGENGAFTVEGRTNSLLKVAMIGYRDTIIICDKEDVGTIRMAPCWKRQAAPVIC